MTSVVLEAVREDGLTDGFDLPPKKRQFVELYAFGTPEEPELAGNATQCYGRVYPHLDLTDSTSRVYGNASNEASGWLRSPWFASYYKALIEQATRKGRGRLHQNINRAVTVLLAVMEGEIRSRLQLDAAVRVLELNGITPVVRTEFDIGETMDSLIRDLAGRRKSPYLRPKAVEVPALTSGREGGKEDDGGGE